MEELLLRMWNDFGARVTGPLSFRLLMQPTMAITFAVRDGLKDAKAGRPLGRGLVNRIARAFMYKHSQSKQA